VGTITRLIWRIRVGVVLIAYLLESLSLELGLPVMGKLIGADGATNGRGLNARFLG
jgi:hypothetical protein